MNGKMNRFYFVPAILLPLLLSLLSCGLEAENKGCEKDYENHWNKGIADHSIMVLIDVSSSMGLMDLEPSRFQFAKEAAKQLALKLLKKKGKAVGLASFSQEPVLGAPISTHRKRFLSGLVDLMHLKEDQPTSIGIALAHTIDKMRKLESPHKSIILLTDGNANTGELHPMDAAKLAVYYNIRIYCVGLGKDDKAPYPITDANGKTTYMQIAVKVNQKLLQQVASRTGGLFFRVKDNNALQGIISTIITHSEGDNTSWLSNRDSLDKTSVDFILNRLKKSSGKKKSDKNKAVKEHNSKGKNTTKAPQSNNKNVNTSAPNKQQIKFSASVNARKIGGEDILILTTTLEGVANATAPTLPEMRHFKLVQTSSSKAFKFIGGKSTYTFYSKFHLSPRQRGNLKIPSITYRLDGKTYRTKPIAITVVEGSLSPPPPKRDSFFTSEKSKSPAAPSPSIGGKKSVSPKDNKPQKESIKPKGISIAVNAQKVGMEDLLVLTLTLHQMKNPAPPDEPELPGFKLKQTSKSNSFSLINGQSSSSNQFDYYFQPLETGTFFISPIHYTHKGKTYKAKSLKIQVVKGKLLSEDKQKPQRPSLFNDDDFFKTRRAAPSVKKGETFLKAQVSKKKVAVGEKFTYRILLYTNQKIKSLNAVSELHFQGVWQQWKAVPESISPSNTTIKGKKYFVYEVRNATLSALEKGPLTLPSLTFDLQVMPEALFGGSPKKIRRAVPPVTIEVY